MELENVEVRNTSFPLRLAVGLLELAGPPSVSSLQRAISSFFYCRQLAFVLGDECGVDLSTHCLHQGVHFLVQLIDDQSVTHIVESIFCKFVRKQRAIAWASYFVGCALVLNFREYEKAVSTGLDLLKTALDSKDPFVRYETSIFLGDIHTGDSVKLKYNKLQLDAAAEIRERDLLVYALYQLGGSLSYNGEQEQARSVEKKLGEINTDDDPLLRGLTVGLSAKIAFGERDSAEAIRLNEECLKHLELVPDSGSWGWEIYFGSCARGSIGHKVSPSRAEWKTKCRQDALNYTVRSQCHLLQLNEAKESVEKLGAYVHQIFQGDVTMETLRLLSCHLYVKEHECVQCQVKWKDSLSIIFEEHKKILEESEPLVAEMLLLSSEAGDWGHYVEAINYAIFIAFSITDEVT